MTWTKPKTAGPTLRFSPTAWAKLLFLRDLGAHEVGGFGLTPAGDLLYVEEIALVKQFCGPVSVLFDDESVADLFHDQVERGRRPEQVARIWIHTHPGNSPAPSATDEATFARVFGECDWAVMFILAADGQTYARLTFNSGPGGSLAIPVEVDFAGQFSGSDQEAWEREYDQCVMLDELFSYRHVGSISPFDSDFGDAWIAAEEHPWDLRWTIADRDWEEEPMIHE